MPQRAITRRNYQKLIRIIRPAFGRKLLSEVRPQAVRTWLLKEFEPGRYRGHIHDMMRRLFKFAMLWEWYPIGENPMSLFSMEGSSKRAKEPRVLTVEQFYELRDKLEDPVRTAVIIAGCLGLRCSEVFGLKWSDFDFYSGKVKVQRSFVEGHIDDVKTHFSKKELPVYPSFAQALLQWRQATEFKADSDWVFASPAKAGEQPYYPNMLQYRILRKAGQDIGLDFSLGWHTLRHSYKTWLDERGVELTVQRDLMRHADVRTTAQVYGDVSMDRLRGPNGELVEQLLRRAN
jgi:integrase